MTRPVFDCQEEEMFKLDEKSNVEGLSDQKQENDRCLGSVNTGTLLTVYHMYCGGAGTRERQAALEGYCRSPGELVTARTRVMGRNGVQGENLRFLKKDALDICLF